MASEIIFLGKVFSESEGECEGESSHDYFEAHEKRKALIKFSINIIFANTFRLCDNLTFAIHVGR